VRAATSSNLKMTMFNNTGCMSNNTQSVVSEGNHTASMRTLNLKKEINSLDQEIMQL